MPVPWTFDACFNKEIERSWKPHSNHLLNTEGNLRTNKPYQASTVHIHHGLIQYMFMWQKRSYSSEITEIYIGKQLHKVHHFFMLSTPQTESFNYSLGRICDPTIFLLHLLHFTSWTSSLKPLTLLIFMFWSSRSKFWLSVT